MSADTGTQLEVLNQTQRLAALSKDALSNLIEGKRTSEMTQQLLRALQLYKENQLGEVLSFSIPEERSAINQVQLIRRRAFAERIRRYGEREVTRQFAQSLSGRIRNVLDRAGLRDILHMTPEAVVRRAKGLGRISLPKLEQALYLEGLCLGMSYSEIEEVFGPPRKESVLAGSIESLDTGYRS